MSPPPDDSDGEEPDYRFTLANERTFLAWIRTSLALLAAGIAVVQLVPLLGIAAGRYLVGESLIALSILVAVDSVRRWERAQHAMRHRLPMPASRVPRILAAGLTVISVVGFVLVLAGRS